MLYFFAFDSAMVQISVVIISFNESLQIGRCLDSVKDLADEIIVVDSFSTDDTVQIAQSKGALIFQNPFEGHIQQKNYALTKARFDYILSLDADEALDENLKNSILFVKSNWNRDAYYCNRFNNYCGYWVKYCGWYPDRKLRLFNKKKGHWTGTNPHDRYELFEGFKNTEVLNGNILHFSYSSVSQHIKQMKYFAKIASNEMYSRHKKHAWFHMIFNPILHFIKSYILKRGFLDGWRGLQICSISSYGTFLKYFLLLKRNLSSNES